MTARAHPHSRRRRSSARRRPPGLFIGVVLGIAGIAVLTFLRDTTPAGLATAPVTVTGQPLPQIGPTPDPALGLLAPSLRGTAIDGTPTSIKPAGDGPLLLVFLAHWCPHCENELRWLIPELKADPPQGVRVVAVTIFADARRPNWPSARWLQERGWPSGSLLDSDTSQAAAAYGVTGTPTWVAIDSTGRVISRTSGEIGSEDLRALISSMT